MNIVWKRPDGSLAVTYLSPEAIERMAWATSPENQELLASKDELVARQCELERQAASVGTLIEKRDEAVKSGAELDVIEALHAQLETTAAAVEKSTPEYAEILVKLRTVERVEYVRDAEGFDEHAHELILQERGSVPADHVCVGHAMALPGDYEFFDAWTIDAGGAVVIDMARAREVHKNRMRVVRHEKFKPLDIAYQRAQEKGDVQAINTVVAQKQILRDVTLDPRIAKAATPDELAGVWPDCLK